MGVLRDRAEKLGIEVDGRWSNGTLQRKIAEREAAADLQKRREDEPPNKVAVRLLKNHHPRGWYRVLGHYDRDNKFVAGEPAPPPFPGVKFEDKLWARTVVELPPEDAQRLVENTVQVMVTDRDETGKAIRRRMRPERKALAEIYTDWTRSIAAAVPAPEGAPKAAHEREAANA